MDGSDPGGPGGSGATGVSLERPGRHRAGARAVAAARSEPARELLTMVALASCTLADLRVVALTPRSSDIVQCTLLERIANAELVLDRLVETLRPGGLLLLRSGDRDSAACSLDRVLPRALRALMWRGIRPYPYPAVYERLVSGRGIQSYAQRRGLVISQRKESSSLAGPGRQRPGLLLACQVVERLSLGRLSCGHDELRYVIRKPQPGFARALWRLCGWLSA